MKFTKHDEKLLEITKNSYEKIAVNFSQTRNYIWADLKIFLEYIKDGDSVLDLGCGNGRLSELFKDKKVNYLGIDPVKSLIAEAKKKYPKLKFKLGDILTFNAKEKFDVIVCTAVLNHLPSEQLQLIGLKNIFKALKPGGYLLMSNWNLYNENNKKGLENFKKIKAALTDEEFEKIYGLKKVLLKDKDVLTKWGDGKVLYYYAFHTALLALLAIDSGFKNLKNLYSLRGRAVSPSLGNNIISIFSVPKR